MKGFFSSNCSTNGIFFGFLWKGKISTEVFQDFPLKSQHIAVV